MSKKIFYFDIDGTLAIKGKVTDSNVEVLKQLKELGHYVFICSGRPIWYIKERYKQYVDGMIASNGRIVEYNDKIIYDKPIDKELVKKVIDICNNEKCGYLLVSDKLMYEGNSEYVYGANDYKNCLDVKDYNVDDINVYMLDVFYKDNNHFNKIRDRLKGTLILNDHFTGSADCSTLDENKGTSVNKVTKLLNVEYNDSYAFGDGDNDISMFKNVEHAIVMGNGTDLAKEAGNYITDNIENDGILKALEKFDIL